MLLFSGAEGLITQAREWEAKAEYNQAIACYCKVSSEMTSDIRFVGCFQQILGRLSTVVP